MLKRFIEQLTKDLDLEDSVSVDQAGVFSLHFEPQLDVTLKEVSDSKLCLRASLALVPKKDRAEFLERVMGANLFGKETGRAVLGMEKESLILKQFVLDDLNYGQFRDCLEEFVNYAEAWREETVNFGNR